MPLPVIDLYNTIFPKTKKARKAHQSGLCGGCSLAQALACSLFMDYMEERDASGTGAEEAAGNGPGSG